MTIYVNKGAHKVIIGSKRIHESPFIIEAAPYFGQESKRGREGEPKLSLVYLQNR